MNKEALSYLVHLHEDEQIVIVEVDLVALAHGGSNLLDEIVSLD